MVKSRFWIGITLAPILFATAGCNITHRSFATSKRATPQKNLMQIAKDLEAQGRNEEAKAAYKRVLDVEPELEALKRLDALYALDTPQQFPTRSDYLQRKTEIAGKANNSADKAPSLFAKSLARKRDTSANELVATTNHPKKSESLQSSKPDRESQLPSPETAAKSVSVAKSEPKPAIRIHPLAVPAASERTDAELDEVGMPETAETAVASSDELLPSPEDDYRIGEGQSTVASTDDLPPSPEASSVVRQPESSIEQPMADEPTVAATTQESYSEPNSTTIANTKIVDVEEEFAPFATPVVRDARTMDSELSQFFGEFHMGMVTNLKERRAHFQPMLVEVVADRNADSEVRSRAVFLLGAVGPAAVDAVPGLRREMQDETDEFLRIDMAEALVKIQPADRDAIGVLVKALKSTDAEAQWIAAFAIRSAASSRTTFVIDPLIAALDTDDLKLKRMVFLTLAEFGPAATKAVPELEAALESTDLATREVAKAALESILADQKTSQFSRSAARQTQLANNR